MKMRYCNKKMRFYCHLLVVSIVIEAVFAANATASESKSDKHVSADIKNKRQVNQFLQTPGASAATSIGTESEPQAFPLQLSHGIYSQQRLPLYTRRPTTITKQVTEDTEIQEPQQQQQQQHQSILPSYYNFSPDVEEDDNPQTVHIDSRHLPVEPRNKVQIYQSTPARGQHSYSTVKPKQNTQAQTLISEDEYLDLIRNTDLVKHSQPSGSKAHYGYVTAVPTSAIDSAYDYNTKPPFSNNEYKKYTSRTHVPSTASSPVPHLQSQTSVQQIARQPPQYVSQTAQYANSGLPQNFGQSFENKDTVRVNLKKYHESAGKTKYDPARGQYHQEVSVKPTKKLVSFKPSYQYATTPQIQISSSNQQSIIQSQPLHYQSVQQISQSDATKSVHQQIAQPQSQYSIIVPQSNDQANQAYYSPDANNPFQSYLPQHDRLIADNYGHTGSELLNSPSAPQQSDIRANGQPDFRIQYVHHISPTPTPTPTPKPRQRFVIDSTQSQPLKYELYDPNGNVDIAKDAPPKIKLIPAPQHVHRPQYAEQPQYYKKIKLQPAAHVHYVPARAQYHQPTAQPSPQAQSDLLIPIQPSRSSIFAGQSTGQVESVSLSSPEKLVQSIPHGHQTHSEPRKPALPITSPKKPISQAEFQALIDAGYKVQAIPVPVPVPVTADKYKQLQYQQQQQQQQQQRHPVQQIHHPGQHTRQATTHYVRYHPKQESEEGILTSYLKPLIEYIGGPGQ